MLDMRCFRSMTLCAALMFGATWSIGKAIAQEAGTLSILSVNVDTLVESMLGKVASDLRDSLREGGIRRRSPTIIGDGSVSVTVPRPEDFDAAMTALSALVRDERGWNDDGMFEALTIDADRETGIFILRLAPPYIAEVTGDLAERASRIVRCRVPYGVEVTAVAAETIAVWSNEATLNDSGNSHHRCGARTFALHAVSGRGSHSDIAKRITLPGHRVLRDFEDATTFWQVKRTPIVSGDRIASVTPEVGPRTGTGSLNIRFDWNASRALADWTLNNVGERIAVVVDGKVVSAPYIREPIMGGSVLIEMQLPPDRNEQLAAELDPILAHVRFEQIAACEKTRAEARRDPSCGPVAR